MKKIFLYGLLLGGLSLFPSCEDFLEKEPPLYVTEQDVFTDSERLAANVNSLYLGLKSQYALGGKVFVIVDNIGDDFINVAGNGYELTFCYDMKVTLDRQENYELWRYTYLAINRCNVFLKNIEDFKESAGANYDRYVAEAKFVRALGYYYLHQIYTMPYVLDPNAKSVVLRLQAEVDLTNNDLARSTSGQVLDQILSDLSASGALPTGTGTEEYVARATQAAAEALKMRVYMVKGEWDNAIEAGKKITGYSLADDITSIFKSPYITSENIFSLPFDATNRPGQQYATGYYYIGGRSNEIDVETGIVSIDGYGNLKDDRIAGFTNIPGGGTFLTKYTNTTYVDWLPIFRYAEVLLNLSEAYYNKGDYAQALALLKQVRERSLAPADDELSLDGLTGEALKTAIYNERRLEFLGEGIRALDILRRGETFVKQKGTAYELIVGPDAGINGYVWPIPQFERAQNKLIED
ncbi:MAG: RagB/SusD family nutrient uptake outer membrane protein [Tannerellaceae bacterium]|jgi:tetratricopeptide (TPR) repeat protein|nr:RagB/SusD family nutrient uptake outer membrane protein [Tannerellaceae bacterium]